MPAKVSIMIPPLPGFKGHCYNSTLNHIKINRSLATICFSDVRQPSEIPTPWNKWPLYNVLSSSCEETPMITWQDHLAHHELTLLNQSLRGLDAAIGPNAWQKVDCRQRINYENHMDMSDFLTVAAANSRVTRNSHASKYPIEVWWDELWSHPTTSSVTW